ncbi:cellulose binding domain-containing protein [Actinoplanes sp. CA-030573]|uniref:cellulose binding domain-containing protein n=1 Tax=Actinoplanes sp. CA-030573 TaxID=3239898 RepID=UPI003D8ABD35
MAGSRRRSRWVRLRTGLAAAVAAGLVMLGFQLPAAGADPVVGNATYFDALGAPYGGCGLPQSQLDSPDFVALNVYNTPGDYSFYPRPVADASRVGAWNNGLNCGRFVQVSIGDYCTGVNDGAPNQAFCRNGAWTADAYNGATLTMIVADSCGDSNAWCRDDPNHLDLAKDSLNRFAKNGAAVGDMYPNHWNNRHISWSYVPAPNYTGDIKIGFLQGAQAWWPAIAVSHLANGIHGVEYLSGGTWQKAAMNGDMGQSYIIGGLTSGATNFQIRVRDVNDQLINNGRVYSFALPAACGTQCSQPYTATTYTTSAGGTTSPSTPATPPTTAPTVPPTSPNTSYPTTPPMTMPTTLPAGTCVARNAVVSSWNGGFQATVTIKAGGTPLNGWTARWTFTNGEQITQLWSAGYTQTGNAVTVKNASWNGAVPANATTTFGYTATGTPAAVTVTCTSP